MNALPVIVRELRAEARNPFTFSLRLAGASILLGLLAFFWAGSPRLSPYAGERLFLRLHLALFCSIWVFVPLATADCISRERRERTLGLLFLTPLKPLDIVLAKGLVHGLRALTFGLAVLPVLAVPLLLGGVGWVTCLLSVQLNASAICWALAAGLLASSLCRTRTQGVVLAAYLSAIGLNLFGYLTGRTLFFTVAGGWGRHWIEQWMRGLWLAGQLSVDWTYFPRGPSGPGPGFTSPALLWVGGKVAALSLLGLALTLLVAGRIIRRVWQDRPTPAWQIWFQRVFCTPFLWRAFFDRWIRRKLEHNPIGWLEQRQWTGRTGIAAWLAVIITFYVAMLQDSSLYHRLTTELQSVLAWLLAISVAVAAANSFRRERELGVMELLLVTPLGARAIALGRLRGIWEQFFPAIALLLGVWIYIASTFGHPSDWRLIVFAATSFLSAPVVGLFFSLRQRSLIGAAVWTLGVDLLVPMLCIWLLGFGVPDVPKVAAFPIGSGVQVLLTMVYWRRLKAVLTSREFPMDVQ